MQALYPEAESIKELWYCYTRHIDKIPRCPVCGAKVKYCNITIGYASHCSRKCSNNDPQRMEKIQNTMMERYGAANASQIEEFQQKKIQTSLIKYGYEHYTNIEQAKKTCLERYGVEKPSTLQSFKDKYRENSLRKYGVVGYNNRDKMRETKIARYGTTSYNNREKSKDTNLKRYGVENPNQIAEVRQRKFEKFQSQNQDVISSVDTVMVCKCPHPECEKCQEKTFTTYRQVRYNRFLTKSEQCTKLLPIGKVNKGTTIELFVQDILKRYNIEFETNKRCVISKELDIYIPSLNVAFECNGVRWHSDVYKPKDYHIKKQQECQKEGIKLIYLWEDQIYNFPDKVESIVTSKLGIYKERYFARKCEVKHITSYQYKNFVEMYHLQGFVNSPVRYGLFHNDELVSIMSFGTKRKCMGKEAVWEMHRYCCKKDVQVIGGASKLFDAFLKEYHPSSVESFASNDISDGALYTKLGFKKCGFSASYWYIDKNNYRYHRYHFAKHNLVQMGYDKNKSEHEITKEMGLYCIYDSGQTKYKWIKQ